MNRPKLAKLIFQTIVAAVNFGSLPTSLSLLHLPPFHFNKLGNVWRERSAQILFVSSAGQTYRLYEKIDVTLGEIRLHQKEGVIFSLD